MHKKYILIVTLVTIIMFFSGCVNINNTNDASTDDTNNKKTKIMDLESIIQLTDFTNNLDHKYSSISGNGEKIIYIQYPDQEYLMGDFNIAPCTLWVTDTSGSKIPQQIFNGWFESGNYVFQGDNGGTPVLNYDATYAYFGVKKFIYTSGFYSRPDQLCPNYLARVRLSDNSFQPIDLITYGEYEQTWLQTFKVKSDKIYCLVTLEDYNPNDVGNTIKGRAFMRMNHDGSDQEFIYVVTDQSIDPCPRTGYCFFVDEITNRLYYESSNVDYYYYIDLNTNTPVKIDNDEIDYYWLKGVSGNKLILYRSNDFYIYDVSTQQLSEIEYEGNGHDSYSITSDKIYYCKGGGLFSYMDFEGNYIKLIGTDPQNFSSHQGLYEWDGQFTPTNGKPVSDDGTKLLVKENWQDFDNPNYYILKLSGSSSSITNNDNTDDTTDNPTDDDTTINPATIIHSIQMFDFSTGQYVTEDWTTEDLDVILITTDNKARLYAHNNALIREVGEADYLSYIDVPEGSICELVDSEGGTATFTVDSIGTTTDNYPTAIITWSYTS